MAFNPFAFVLGLAIGGIITTPQGRRISSKLASEAKKTLKSILVNAQAETEHGEEEEDGSGEKVD